MFFITPLLGEKNEDGELIVRDEEFSRKFWTFTETVGELQINLAIQDIWTRSAIVYDMLRYSPEGIIVGPAFHRAYELERNVAKFPSVIVDSKIIKASGHESISSFIETINAVEPGAEPLFPFLDGITPLGADATSSIRCVHALYERRGGDDHSVSSFEPGSDQKFDSNFTPTDCRE